MAAPAVVAHDVHKEFRDRWFARAGRTRVLAGLSISVNPGAALAIMGSNGAGKTTLLKILAAAIVPDSGTVAVCGYDGSSVEARRRTGFGSGDERSFYLRLSAWENLRFFAALHGVAKHECERRVDEIAVSLGLDEFLGRRVDQCSSGMRARLALARAVLHRPRLLLLDEPTKSLDAEHTKLVRSALRTWMGEGTAVVLATHVIDEARELSAEIAVLQNGRLAQSPSQ